MKDTPKIEMYNRDCMELMAEYPDNHFDLAIVDPPYGIGVDKMNLGKGGGLYNRGDYKRDGWDDKSPSNSFFNELMRVSKNQIIWGGNYFLLPISKGWVVWEKRWKKQMDFAPFELAWTSFSKCSVFKFLWNGFWQGDMSNKETRIHPTQKPVALYKWLLTNYANEGDKILDTHGGSGSICIACHDLKFDLVWTELDPDYYASAVQRYEQHAAQLQMF